METQRQNPTTTTAHRTVQHVPVHPTPPHFRCGPVEHSLCCGAPLQPEHQHYVCSREHGGCGRIVTTCCD